MIHELELELEHEQEDYNSRLYHFHGMQQGNTGCHVKSMSVDQLACRSTEAGGPKNKGSSEKQQTGWSVHQGNENGLKLPVPHEDPKTKLPSGKYISRRYYISIRKMVCEKCCRWSISGKEQRLFSDNTLQLRHFYVLFGVLLYKQSQKPTLYLFVGRSFIARSFWRSILAAIISLIVMAIIPMFISMQFEFSTMIYWFLGFGFNSRFGADEGKVRKTASGRRHVGRRERSFFGLGTVKCHH